ncbi:hypothetical protein BBJ28_00012827 [Nothophytophthora sp. Chile5]|nr:hypothetical protein BBJ28_00012827 [Nothophytophthora sp. Chile5]
MAKKKATAAATKRKADAAAARRTAQNGEEKEERPILVRVLTIGVASYLAHKIWTKRKSLTAQWYSDSQSETEQGMVTAFEYLSSMGMIFVIGIVVGVVFSKISKWVKGTSSAAIGENTVVDLSGDGALGGSNAAGARFSRPQTAVVAPSPRKQKKKKNKQKKAEEEAEANAAQPKTKKRPRESVVSGPVHVEKKRKMQLETLLDELEAQVQEQCDDLVADAERRAQELEMELKVQLLFLPEAVRQMPWKTFVDDFGGDLQNVIHSVALQQQTLSSPHRSPSQARATSGRHSIVAATPGSGADVDAEDDEEATAGALDPTVRNRRLSAFATPMDRHDPAFVPHTVLRTARKGETTYSARGSPIIPDTVVKAPAGSLVTTFEADLEPTTCLRLDSERVLDLSRPEELSAASRGEATSKLQALQAKVAQLLRQINPCAR